MDTRAVINGIFYIIQAADGVSAMGNGLFVLARFKQDGTWQKMHAALRMPVRVQSGRDPEPTAAIIDSQSVKTTKKGSPWV